MDYTAEQGNYRMIVLDIDGTLTNTKKEITPRTKERLIEIQKEGIVVVLASGRPTSGIRKVAQEIELEKYGGYILAYNGGRIIQAKTGDTIYSQTVSPEYVEGIYQVAMECGTSILTYDEDTILLGAEANQYCELEARICETPMKQVDDFVEEIDFPVNKFLLPGDPEKVYEAQTAMRENLGEHLNIFRSEEFFLEVVPKGIDKALSLQQLLNHLGMTREEMICCGDGFNDQTMIEYAGLGVAMGNAKPEVKEAADYITASNDEDGIVQVIDNFLM